MLRMVLLRIRDGHVTKTNEKVDSIKLLVFQKDKILNIVQKFHQGNYVLEFSTFRLLSL